MLPLEKEKGDRVTVGMLKVPVCFAHYVRDREDGRALCQHPGALLSILLCEKKEAPHPSVRPQAQSSVTVPHPGDKIPKADPQS